MKEQAYQSLLKSMPHTVREFATYKTAIENRSPKTIEEYVLDLRTFFRYIIATRHGIELDSQDFYDLELSSVGIEFVKTIGTESCRAERMQLLVIKKMVRHICLQLCRVK